MNILTDTIRTRRLELGLTQRELADKACCCIETVSELESNKRNVGMDTVLSVLNVLGIRLVIEHD